MEVLERLLHSTRLWYSVAVLLVALLCWFLLKRGANWVASRLKSRGRRTAYIHSILGCCRLILLLLTLIWVLQINGINVTSLVTGLGVAGIVVGFALQDLLKDIIMGVNIVWDGYFSVGDIVRYGEVPEGRVIAFTLKSTKIQDVESGDVLTVSNRNISEITKLSDRVDVTVPAPYGEPAERMRTVCRELCRRVESLEPVSECRFLGTDEFAESLIAYRLRVFCSPEQRQETRRAVLGIIQDVYAEQGIAVPFNQLDVHLDR